MAQKEHILIVDDEPSIRLFLSEELSQAGYRVSTASSGEQALARLEEERIDLVLLDLKMGGMDGLQVMAEVKEKPLPPVVIMLTAHASLDSAIEAMRRGGHDYLLKPCRTEELLASVEQGLARRRERLHQQELLRLIEQSARQLQAVSGQAQAAREPQAETAPRFLEARGLLLDLTKQTASRQGEALHLTPTEFQILRCLMEQPGEVVSYPALMEALHGEEEAPAYEARQALSTHVWRLRNKLGEGPNGRPYVANVRGQGYKFVGEDESA